MTGYSAIEPAQIVPHNGGYQLRYNIEQITREVDGETVTEWQFEYVNVPDLDRATLIDALITARYSHTSQLGKLALDRDSDEWAEYAAFRAACYALAEAVTAVH